MAKERKMSGFTLIEVLISLAMFGIGMFMLTQLFSSMQVSQRNVLYQTAALNAARSEIEYLKTADFDTITDGNSFATAIPSSLPNGSGSLAVSTPTVALNMKQVDATVTYDIGGISKSVTLTTYISRPEAQQQ